MPMPSFNLLDEPWIPCAERAGGTPRLLLVGAVVAEGTRLAKIAGPSPAVTVSLYRLLLAILHRALDGPQSVEQWRSAWERGQWDLDRIEAYLQRWHDRFDLFDAQYPVYQTPGLDARPVRPPPQLTFERAADRNRALRCDQSPDPATP